MRILLDTHIWLWSLREPERLGSSIRRELVNLQNELWLSPISTWEALVLNSKGRIRIHGEPSSWVARTTAKFHEAPLTHEISMVACELDLPHFDPADRFLAATAKVLDLTLATADRRLLDLGSIKTIANR